ncbi:MAG: DUF6326 family protein [Pseudolysinimonas sp.]
MTNSSATPLATPQLPVPTKLAAAWTSFMFLYLYVDVLNFYKPGVVAGILEGRIWEFEVSATLITIALVSVSIPAVMIALSVILPARANRITNIVVAALLIPYSAFNAAGATLEWAGFYGISIAAEVLLLAFIIRSAVKWLRASERPADGL